MSKEVRNLMMNVQELLLEVSELAERFDNLEDRIYNLNHAIDLLVDEIGIVPETPEAGEYETEEC